MGRGGMEPQYFQSYKEFCQKSDMPQDKLLQYSPWPLSFSVTAAGQIVKMPPPQEWKVPRHISEGVVCFAFSP